MLRVLVSAPYLQPALDRFRPALTESGIEPFAVPVQERLSEAELMTHAGAIDGAVCGDDAFTAAVLRAFRPRLRVISKWGTGVDSIDREASRRLGIAVYNTPGAFTDPVADSVLGYILAFARQLPWMDAEVKAGGWAKRPGRSLRECTLGVVGVGRIGKAVLLRAKSFGMELLGNDVIDIAPSFLRRSGTSLVSLPELVERSDFISINCDLNPSSRQLVNRRLLERVKPGAILINTARGAVVDEAALVVALRSGRLSGAGLDVFEDEPLPVDSPFRTMDQVLLAAHNANSSPEAWERVHRNTLRNLLRGLGLPAHPAFQEPTSGDAPGPARRRSGRRRS